MIKFQVLLGLFIALNVMASGPLSLRKEVIKVLPSELVKISPADSSKELEKKFAKKIKKKERPSALYLHYFENKNDVTIGLKDGHFDYLYVEPPRARSKELKGLYEKSLSRLTKAQKEKLVKEMREGKKHEAGQTITVDLPQEGLQLTFMNNEAKDLHSLVLWPLQKEKQ